MCKGSAENFGWRRTFGRIQMVRAAITLLLLFGLVCTTQILPQAQAGDSVSKLPEFEVAPVRLMPDRDKLPDEQQLFSMTPDGAAQFRVRNITLPILISFAFGVDSSSQIVGKPDWLDDAFYEISAKPEGDLGLTPMQLRPFFQQLLQERFHFAYHRETRNFKGYALSVAKGGPKLKESKGESSHAYILPGALDAVSTSMPTLALMLAHPLGQPIADKTGLKGNFDFQINFAPIDSTDTSKPSLFTAVKEQLGLKLEKQMVPVPMIVIDHIQRVPTEN